MNSTSLFDTNATSGVEATNTATGLTKPEYDGPVPNYSIFGKFDDFFTGKNKRAEAEYQQWLEDHAVQRRMWDLKEAGINPVLAAQGQGAATTSGYANGANTSTSVSKNMLSMAKTGVAILTAVKLMKILSLLA